MRPRLFCKSFVWSKTWSFLSITHTQDAYQMRWPNSQKLPETRVPSVLLVGYTEESDKYLSIPFRRIEYFQEKFAFLHSSLSKFHYLFLRYSGDSFLNNLWKFSVDTSLMSFFIYPFFARSYSSFAFATSNNCQTFTDKTSIEFLMISQRNSMDDKIELQDENRWFW